MAKSCAPLKGEARMAHSSCELPVAYGEKLRPIEGPYPEMQSDRVVSCIRRKVAASLKGFPSGHLRERVVKSRGLIEGNCACVAMEVDLGCI